MPRFPTLSLPPAAWGRGAGWATPRKALQLTGCCNDGRPRRPSAATALGLGSCGTGREQRCCTCNEGPPTISPSRGPEAAPGDMPGLKSEPANCSYSWPSCLRRAMANPRAASRGEIWSSDRTETNRSHSAARPRTPVGFRCPFGVPRVLRFAAFHAWRNCRRSG